MFLSFNYPQRDVWPLFIWSNLCCFYRSIILNAFVPLFIWSHLCCFYLAIILNAPFNCKQPLLFLSFNYPQRDVWPLFIWSNLLFLSFNYPQAAVWPFFIWSNLCCFSRSIIRHAPITLFTLSNLCCFYRSIILNARFSHCVYEATIFLSFNYPQRAVYIVYIKRPLLFQRAVWPLFILSNLCCFYRSITLNAPFGHCLYEATFVVFIVQLSSTRRLAIDYIKQPLLFLSSIILNAPVIHCIY